MVTRRLVRSSGNSIAEGWLEPFLQKAGLSGTCPVAASHRRPLRSNIGLWLFALLSQMFSSPQYADAGRTRLDAAHPGVLVGLALVHMEFRDRPRRQLAELMAADAAIVAHGVDPVGLLDLLRDVGVVVRPELVFARDLEHRVPVDRRI